MNLDRIKIRTMKRDDFDAVVKIDSSVFGAVRPEYYEGKFFCSMEVKDQMVASMVAEVDGQVVGFVMCEFYLGEYGIASNEATVDTIGIRPDFQRAGIGRMLIEAATKRLKAAGVVKINTLVVWDDARMVPFFSSFGFNPSPTINLELIP